ncbi:Por secretion system C-terminal sorting domain-containing protein [Reichenbachiella faecimaris]|uniref:Por secretion system C-terminal sorting domain-containing protein n=1 Tax=Reichenbachiella faecimaris TaxID=692418 RepID=A0A1W2GJ27_REIFA|nr:T9SS type A sorting domain-containing protein [Reichenbachiella faecimaris]SMD36544.1 Por secretion system C-terminal sorting domain-containing protein [Reichenbachiella faecimaris]
MQFLKVIGSVVLLLAATSAWAQDSTSTTTFTAESLIFENESLDLTNQIEVYPNPSVDYIVVNIKNSNLRETSFELHSIIGNTVLVDAENIGRDKYRINIKNFNPGYYFVIVKDDFSQFKEAYKFLKK